MGGLLIAGEKEHYEFSRIKCARFKGVDMTEFIDHKEFGGPLYDQVESAMKFAKVYIAKGGKVRGLQRIDAYEAPLEAVREALVNAVVHRDYSISGSDIKFAIFDDRIEITSPGVLPKALELKNILSGRSEVRNRVVARFFKEIKFIEQWGVGVAKILRSCRDAGLRKPDFRESGLFFKVTIYKEPRRKEGTCKTGAHRFRKTSRKTDGKIFQKSDEEASRKPDEKSSQKPDGESSQKPGQKASQKPNGKTSQKSDEKAFQKPDGKTSQKSDEEASQKPDEKTSQKIVKLMKENPSITKRKLAESIGISDRAIKYNINRLKERGIVRRVGPARGGRWKVRRGRV